MELTSQNEAIAELIISTLAKEKCTIEQAQSILSYVGRQIVSNSIVQKS